MNDEARVSEEGKFLGYVEGAIFGMFVLIGKVIRTAPTFVVKPDSVWAGLRVGADRRRQESAYAPPLTYLVIMLGVLVAAFAALFQLEPWRRFTADNPFLRFFIGALKDVNEKKIFLVLLPFLLAVALFAWSIGVVARPARVTFEKSIALAAYLYGTVAALYCVAAPFMVLLPSDRLLPWRLPLWGWLVGIAGWSVIIKSMHSYLHVLRRELGVSRRRVVAVLLKGWALFLVLYYAVLFWSAPLVFRRFEGRFPEFF